MYRLQRILFLAKKNEMTITGHRDENIFDEICTFRGTKNGIFGSKILCSLTIIIMIQQYVHSMYIDIRNAASEDKKI